MAGGQEHFALAAAHAVKRRYLAGDKFLHNVFSIQWFGKKGAEIGVVVQFPSAAGPHATVGLHDDRIADFLHESGGSLSSGGQLPAGGRDPCFGIDFLHAGFAFVYGHVCRFQTCSNIEIRA